MAADVYIEFAANANKKKGETRPVGLEPTIAWLEVRRLIH